MNKNFTNALSTSLLAIGSLMIMPPAAQSQDFSNFLRNTFGDFRNNGQQNRTYSSNLNSTMLQTMNSYDAKRTNLENKISQAYADSRISSEQANDWRAQLKTNAIQQNSSTSDGYFTFNEAQSVLDELTKIESRFDSAISVTTTTSLNQDSNWNRGVGHDRYRNHDKWRNNNNINQTQNDILYRLTQAKRDRRLSYKDYANLKSQYDRIVGREAEARNGRGRVSSEERRDLMNRLNNLDDSITRHMNNRRVSGRTYRNSR